MKTTIFLSLVVMLAFFPLMAISAPSLDIRNAPVQNNGFTGPENDPASAMGQWFYNPVNGIETSRTHEFYDNPSIIGDQGVFSIKGVVTELIKAG